MACSNKGATALSKVEGGGHNWKDFENAHDQPNRIKSCYYFMYQYAISERTGCS